MFDIWATIQTDSPFPSNHEKACHGRLFQQPLTCESWDSRHLWEVETRTPSHSHSIEEKIAWRKVRRSWRSSQEHAIVCSCPFNQSVWQSWVEIISDSQTPMGWRHLVQKWSLVTLPSCSCVINQFLNMPRYASLSLFRARRRRVHARTFVSLKWRKKVDLWGISNLLVSNVGVLGSPYASVVEIIFHKCLAVNHRLMLPALLKPVLFVVLSSTVLVYNC